MPSSRGSSWLRDQTHVTYVSCIGRQVHYHWATWEALISSYETTTVGKFNRARSKLSLQMLPWKPYRFYSRELQFGRSPFASVTGKTGSCGLVTPPNKNTLAVDLGGTSLPWAVLKILCHIREGASPLTTQPWISQSTLLYSPSQTTWMWANSGRQWRKDEPGGLQSMGSQRIGHNLATKRRGRQMASSRCRAEKVIPWSPRGAGEAAGSLTMA